MFRRVIGPLVLLVGICLWVASVARGPQIAGKPNDNIKDWLSRAGIVLFVVGVSLTGLFRR